MSGGDGGLLIAHVVVDVPTMQTDKGFDYSIPAEYRELIEPGMRVQVPFGVRTVMGYVLAIQKGTDFAGELKPISGLMDDEPVLSAELLALGQHMASNLFCFLVECYHTMLPNLLKVNYEKYFLPTEQLSFINRELYFNQRHEISWQQAESEKNLDSLIDLKRRGEVTIDYRVEDRKHYKMEKWIQPLLDWEALEQQRAQVSKRAKKQMALLEVLQLLDGKKVSAKYLKEEYQFELSTLRKGAEKGWLVIYEQQVKRNPFVETAFAKTAAKALLPQQQIAFDQVKTAMDNQQAATFLLQGVTGSGKTEVYLHLIQQALLEDKTALLLVPEISLTPQMITHLKGRFGELVAVLHSRLSVGEHFDEWRKLKAGTARIAVGARSSIFAPLTDIGIIILDEEHETTYKQNDSPRYHAREVAKWRAEYHNCPVVLGSATPSLESRARAQNGVYQLLEMSTRTNRQPLPEVTLVDMRQEYRQKNYHQFSRLLKKQMDVTLAKGQQVALMLNRRGFANYMMCRDCGYVFGCPNCDVSLTYHYQDKSLKCHYCGHETHLPQSCPHCHGKHIADFGTGTERVEAEIHELFPDKTVVRMDIDTTRKKGSHAKILKQIEDGTADILLGTQMIAKGLDFQNITLVGVINADTSLYLPDFRAAERTFQLITQVSGRAGRGDLAGQVIVQSFNPEHYSLQLAQRHDYNQFYQTEMQFRKMNHYSPYYYTIRFVISSIDEKTALQSATKVAGYLKEAQVTQGMTKIIGPSKSAIARIKNRYYFQILYQYRQRLEIQTVLDQIQQQAQKWSKDHIYIAIDVEPLTFM